MNAGRVAGTRTSGCLREGVPRSRLRNGSKVPVKRSSYPAGRSVEIPLEERFEGAREKEQLSRGGSVDIPLEDRFESARREREKLSRGKSADIPYEERKGGGDR